MKTLQQLPSKQLLGLQLFTLIPTILFFFLYSQHSLFSMATLFVLLGLMGWSFYKYKYDKVALHRPLVLSLVISFLLYGFTGLGNQNSPKTFDTIKADESVVHFIFDQASPIDKFCYYVGIDYDSFSMEYQHNNKWETFYSYKKDYPYSFRWRCNKVSISNTARILIRPVEHEKLTRRTDNELMLGELRFMHQDKVLPYITSKPHLNDEPSSIIDISYKGGMFFDEIYHGRTAYEIMNNLDIYGNVHPYLGKTLLIPGIKIFGMTPFGWRFSNTLFSAILVFMAYYFGLLIFKEHLYAFTSSLLVTYSFMHLTQSRLAHIDTFGVTFAFISYYYLYKFIISEKLKPLFISGIFFGLASAVKWSAAFAPLGFILILLYLIITKHSITKRFSATSLIKYGLLSYAVLAPFIYLLTFYDIFLKTGSIQSIIDYNTNMYNYNTTLVASHPYSSQWWSWPLDLKPMGYYTAYNGNLKSSINAFGNPAIFWAGIVAIAYLIFSMFKHKSLEASFILFAFIGLYIPYVFVGRLMFIYHFYYAVPFFMLAIVYMFKNLMLKFTSFKYILGIYLFIIVGLFLLFYPVLSGYEVPTDFIKNYLVWLPKWWL